MEPENNIVNIILQIIPMILVIAATILLAWLARRFFDRSPELSSKYAFVRGLIFLAIILLGIISVLMVLPIAESMRKSLPCYEILLSHNAIPPPNVIELLFKYSIASGEVDDL